MQVSVNINEYVWVQLTPDGVSELDTYIRMVPLLPESTYTYEAQHERYKVAPEWWKFQLWELMNIFGAKSYNGGKQLFVKNVISFTPEPLSLT